MRKRPLLLALALLALAWAPPAFAGDEGAPRSEESPVDTLCRLVETSARAQGLPIAFLTRLIERESSFRPRATSMAGAQGIAQFMPGTANERGLADPYDPEEAIPKAAELLADLQRRFGNLGLAAAAYNAGAARVAAWLAGGGALPDETRTYVAAITRHAVEDWSSGATAKIADEATLLQQSCSETIKEAMIVLSRADDDLIVLSPLTTPWGVQISGSFSKAVAVAEYARARAKYSAILGDVEPAVIGGRAPGRGFRAFYRVRAPAATRAQAETLCQKLLRAGAACVVLHS